MPDASARDRSADVLTSTLEQLRPQGAIFFPAAFTDGFVFASPPQRVAVLRLPEPPPWGVIPIVRQGGGGERTDMGCGYLHSAHPLFDPAMRALPPVFVVRLPPGSATGWVQASISYALEQT